MRALTSGTWKGAGTSTSFSPTARCCLGTAIVRWWRRSETQLDAAPLSERRPRGRCSSRRPYANRWRVANRYASCRQAPKPRSSAIRVARGFTGRDRIVKFDGCYHGHADALLAGSGSGVATLGLPGSAGIPSGAVADTLVVAYNEVPVLDERVACVIVEPVAANMGVVAPAPGFLEGLRHACDEVGALLVFDEVITGFRLGLGGASAMSGVVPDLWCFGKVIGGGLPVGAFGGKRQVLEVLAPGGPVYQAGTLSGNPLVTAAGLAVLQNVTQQDYEVLARRVARFACALTEAITSKGLAVQVPVVGPLVGLFFAEEPVTGYGAARASAANGNYARFFTAMLERGVALAPGPYEAMFPGLAHGERELDDVVSIAGEVAIALASAEGV